jgi:hypothetical protein
MATRALIGYLDTDNGLKLTLTYNHYDGYPENLGVGLEKFYNSDAKAEEIANVGYISSLDNETGNWEATNEARPKVINLPDNFNEAMMEIAEQIDSVGASYSYIWDNDNEEWITVDNKSIRSMTQDLEMSLAHLKEKFSMLPNQPNQTMENKNKIKEGYFGANNEVEELIDTLGYESLDEFFDDNPGVVTVILDWAAGVPEFKRKMIDNGLLETKKEELDEDFIAKMKYRAGIIK